jgi:hypothetical protein
LRENHSSRKGAKSLRADELTTVAFLRPTFERELRDGAQ